MGQEEDILSVCVLFLFTFYSDAKTWCCQSMFTVNWLPHAEWKIDIFLTYLKDFQSVKVYLLGNLNIQYKSKGRENKQEQKKNVFQFIPFPAL